MKDITITQQKFIISKNPSIQTLLIKFRIHIVFEGSINH